MYIDQQRNSNMSEFENKQHIQGPLQPYYRGWGFHRIYFDLLGNRPRASPGAIRHIVRLVSTSSFRIYIGHVPTWWVEKKCQTLYELTNTNLQRAVKLRMRTFSSMSSMESSSLPPVCKMVDQLIEGNFI